MGYRTRYECTFCGFTATAPERMTVHTEQSRHGGHREIRFMRKSKNRSGSAKRRARRERQQGAEDQQQAALDKKLKQSLRQRDR